MKADQPPLVPPRQRPHIVLHGYGATPADIAAIGPLVDPGHELVTIAPQGTITAGAGYSWYDFDSATWTPDPDSFFTAVKRLDRFVDAVCARASVGRDEIVIGGFSQGAGVAAWLAFGTTSPRPAGLWCCGTIVDVAGDTLDLTAARGTNVLMLAGRHDPNIPLERNHRQADQLRAAGAHVTISEHDGGHALSQPMLADMRHWLEHLDNNS